MNTKNQFVQELILSQDSSKKFKIAKSEILFTEGELGEFVYFLESGGINILRNKPKIKINIKRAYVTLFILKNKAFIVLKLIINRI